MKRLFIILPVSAFCFFYFHPLYAASAEDYSGLRQAIVKKYSGIKPVRFSPWTRGVKRKIITDKKIAALTLDACGGKRGSAYDRKLIEFLKREKIPATLFLCGRWIDSNLSTAKALSLEKNFEIENHGLKHRPCSVKGLRAYGRKGTLNPGEVADEVELNARKIQALTGRRPVFFRSGTAFYDDVAVKIIYDLKHVPVNFSVISGDAVKSFSSARIGRRIIKGTKRGAIIIGHMNQPDGRLLSAVRKSTSVLRRKGYRFVKLEEYRDRLK